MSTNAVTDCSTLDMLVVQVVYIKSCFSHFKFFGQTVKDFYMQFYNNFKGTSDEWTDVNTMNTSIYVHALTR